MTYNVFSGTLNPTQSINQSSYIAYVENDKKNMNTAMDVLWRANRK